MRRLLTSEQRYRRRLEQHVAERLRDRYGISWSTELRNQVTDAIERGRVPLLYREAAVNQRCHYKLQIDGRPVHLVYDQVRKVICTVLPPTGL